MINISNFKGRKWYKNTDANHVITKIQYLAISRNAK